MSCWTQSLAWLGEMLMDGLIEAADLDPCGRRLPSVLGAQSVLVCLVPDDPSVASRLKKLGLPVSVSDTAGIEVLSSNALRQHLGAVGVDDALGLSGHPPVRPETAASASFTARVRGSSPSFLPCWKKERFISATAEHLVDSVVNELHLLQRHWQGSGSPLLLIPVQASLLERDDTHLLDLTERLRSGCVEDVFVEFANLETLAARAQWHELPHPSPATFELPPTASARQLLRASTDLSDLTAAQEQELDDTSLEELRRRLWSSNSLREQAEVLELLTRRLGIASILSGPQGAPVEIKPCWKRFTDGAAAGGLERGPSLRRCMGLVHPQLDDALIDLLSRQKQVVVGRNYTKVSRRALPCPARDCSPDRANMRQ